MSRHIAPSGFPYASHAVLLHGWLAVSSIIPLVDGFHDRIRGVLLVGVHLLLLNGLLIGELIELLVVLFVALLVGVVTLLRLGAGDKASKRPQCESHDYSRKWRVVCTLVTRNVPRKSRVTAYFPVCRPDCTTDCTNDCTHFLH